MKHLTMRTYVGVKLEINVFLTSATELDGASRFSLFIPGETAHGKHWIGAERVSVSVWTLWKKEKSLDPARNQTPIPQPSSP
jgi:hypothetical protein